MSERKGGRSSKIDPPGPVLPTVSWDFNQAAVPGKVEPSEPNFMIHAFDGRAYDRRGVQGTSGRTVPRRQQFNVKLPKLV